MRTFLAIAALVIAAQARRTFENSLDTKEDFSAFKSENRTHLNSSEKIRADREAKVQIYFGKKALQVQTAKALKAAIAVHKAKVVIQGKKQALYNKAKAHYNNMKALAAKALAHLRSEQRKSRASGRHQDGLVSAAEGVEKNANH
jgi:hypothetical protein